MTTYTNPPANLRMSHRPRFLRACATAAVLLTGSLAGGAAFAGTASASTDVVDAARAGLPDRGELTHLLMKFGYGAPETAASHPLSGHVDAHLPARYSDPESPDLPTYTGEIDRWTALDPLRERTAWHDAMPDGTPGTTEESYADGVVSEWNSRERVTHVRRLSASQRTEYEEGSLGVSRVWVRNAAWGADPIAGIRAMLDGGMLQSNGRVTFEGRSVLRLIGSEPGTEENGSPAGPIEYEYLVDPRTFAPVRVLQTTTQRAPDEHGQGAERFSMGWTFSHYEQLPLNDDTRHLLVAGGGR